MKVRMFSFSDIYHRYTDQDPTRILQYGAIKSAVIFFVFFSISTVLGLDKNLIIITILFIANLAASILIGSIEAKKKAFFMYIVAAIVIVNLSPLVHPIFEHNFMLIVGVVFVAFWSKRFGEAFTFFPVMLTVLTCICFIRFPLANDSHLAFTFVAIAIGLAFYILVIRTYKEMSATEIKTVLRNFSRLFVRDYLEIFEKSRYRRFTQTKVLEASNLKFNNITSLQTHGVMFLKKVDQDMWRYYCYNLILINRLVTRFIFTYKKLNNNHVRMGFSDSQEIEALSKDLEKIFRSMMILILSSQTTNAQIEDKMEEIDYLKYKFEINYIEKYYKDEQKKVVLFDSVLLLDDMFISIKNLKEAYDALIKR